jgi:hypothetical protein
MKRISKVSSTPASSSRVLQNLYLPSFLRRAVPTEVLVIPARVRSQQKEPLTGALSTVFSGDMQLTKHWTCAMLNSWHDTDSA